MAYEKTFVLLKPDALVRNLAAPIKNIFLENNFDILTDMTITPDPDFIREHLNYDPGYAETIGLKVKSLYEQKGGINIFGDDNEQAIGNTLKQWMIDYLTQGDTMAVILGGEDALTRAKKLCGSTFPADADPQSIRGMFGTDNFEICMQERRAPRNIVHAAETQQEAAHQIALWFPTFECVG